MCAPCKVIINEGMQGIIRGLEKVIVTKELSPTLTDQERYQLTQDLLEIDLCAFNGGTIKRSVKDIILTLQDLKVIQTDDIWKVLANG